MAHCKEQAAANSNTYFLHKNIFRTNSKLPDRFFRNPANQANIKNHYKYIKRKKAILKHLFSTDYIPCVWLKKIKNTKRSGKCLIQFRHT
jgi:hypothetical protein